MTRDQARLDIGRLVWLIFGWVLGGSGYDIKASCLTELYIKAQG